MLAELLVSVAAGVADFGEDEVPAIPAVLAAVRHDVTRIPHAVLAGVGEQEAASAAINAHDLGFRGQIASWSVVEHHP